MDVRRLKYFATVAELGSFTKAAERLHVAQPAVSRQVQHLEEELGLELFSRAGRHIRSTDAGEALLRHARTIERDIERLIEDMQSRKETPKGRVILGIPPALADIVIPSIVARVQHEYPFISLAIAEGVSTILSEWVQINKVDLAILGLAHEGQVELLPGLKLEVLVCEDMVVIERPNGADLPISYSLADLRSKPLVISEKFAAIVRSKVAASDFQFNVSLEIDSVQAIKAMVLQGNVATILPVSMLNKEISEGMVIATAITERGVRRQLMLAQPSFRQVTVATQAVLKVLKEEIGRMQCEGLFSLNHFVRDAGMLRKRASRSHFSMLRENTGRSKVGSTVKGERIHTKTTDGI